jgi:hypothetical protein
MIFADAFLYAGIAFAVLAIVIVALKSFGSTKIKRGIVRASHQLHLN